MLANAAAYSTSSSLAVKFVQILGIRRGGHPFYKKDPVIIK